VFAPIWGFLADRHGRKLMVMRSMFGGAVMMTLMGFAPNVGSIIVLRGIQGALTGSVSATVTLVSSVTPATHSGYALGMIQGAVYSGVFIGPLAGGFVCDRFGFRAGCVFAGLFLMAAGLTVALGTREQFTPQPREKHSAHGSIREVLRSSQFVTAIAVILLLNFAANVVAPVFQFLVREMLQAPALQDGLSRSLYAAAQYAVHPSAPQRVGPEEMINTVTGVFFGLAGIAAAFASAGLGRLGDRWGHSRMFVLWGFLSSLVLLPHAFVRSLGGLFLLRLLYGFVSAGVSPSGNAIIRRSVRNENVGVAYGISTSVGAVGWALGPLAGGYIGKHATVRDPYIIAAILFLIVVACAYALLREPEDMPPASSASG